MAAIEEDIELAIEVAAGTAIEVAGNNRKKKRGRTADGDKWQDSRKN